MVENRQKGITKAYRNDKKDNDTRAGEALVLDGNTVLSQLTNALTIQNEFLEDANVINRKNQIMAEERTEKEKDRTKKFHPMILNMLKQAAATDAHDENSYIAPSCSRFINSYNVGMAQLEIIHQFETYNLDDVGFTAGTVQALHPGEFLYSDSSTPSNFTTLHFPNKLQILAVSRWIISSVS